MFVFKRMYTRLQDDLKEKVERVKFLEEVIEGLVANQITLKFHTSELAGKRLLIRRGGPSNDLIIWTVFPGITPVEVDCMEVAGEFVKLRMENHIKDTYSTEWFHSSSLEILQVLDKDK